MSVIATVVFLSHACPLKITTVLISHFRFNIIISKLMFYIKNTVKDNSSIQN